MTILLNLLLTLLIPYQLTNHTDISNIPRPSRAYTSGHKFKTGDLVYVLAGAGLSLREAPNQSGKKIKTVPHCASVTILHYPDSAALISVNEFKDFDIKGYFVQVAYGADTGYVFDGYLSKHKCLPNDQSISEYYRSIIKKKCKEMGIKPKITFNRKKETKTKLYYISDDYYYSLEEQNQIPELETIVLPDSILTKEEAFLLDYYCYLKPYTIKTFSYNEWESKEQLNLLEKDRSLKNSIPKYLKRPSDPQLPGDVIIYSHNNCIFQENGKTTIRCRYEQDDC